MTQNRFKDGFRDGIPIGLGYLSVAFAFGIFAVSHGLTVWESLLISLCNVTSAGQLAAVPIITAGGSLLEIALSQLVINFRYFLMSVSLSQKLAPDMKTKERALFAFVNTDEVFAVASAKEGKLGKFYLFGLILAPYLGWGLGTLVGALAGDILPAAVTAALGIAIYGMFIAIVLPVAKEDKNVGILALVSILFSLAFEYIPFLRDIPSGFSVILAAAGAAAIMAAVRPLPDAEKEETL